MTEMQANAEDDAFGDFEFASFSSVPSRSNPIAAEDDEWGDFVENPLQFQAQAPPNPQPLDLFAGFQMAHVSDPQPMGVSQLQPFGREMKSESAAEKRWENPQGAIPLSIFGEEEVEEESSNVDLSVDAHFSQNGFSAKPVSAPTNGVVSTPNVGFGLNDLIMNLYGRQEEIKTANGAVENSVSVDGSDDFNDDGWEFKDASSESRQEIGGFNSDQNVSKIWDVQAKTATEAEATTPRTPAAGQVAEVAQNGSRIENDLDENINSVENFWEFKDTLSGAGAVDIFSEEKVVTVDFCPEEKVVTVDFFSEEKKEQKTSDFFGAQANAIRMQGIGEVEHSTPNAFSNGKLDYGEKFDNQDGLFQRPVSVSNGIDVLNSSSGNAFGDLILNLYGQAEQTATICSTQQQLTENKLNYPQIGQNSNGGLDEDGWESRDAFSEGKVENGNPESKTLDAHRNLSATSNLYNQAEQTSTVDSTQQQTTENELSSLKIVPNGNENLNEHGWEFRDGLLEGKVQNGNPESKTFDAHGSFFATSNLYSQSEKISTVNSAQQQPTENELNSPQIVPNVDDDFNEEGWEFRDAFSEGKVENGNPESKTSDAHRNFSATLNLYNKAEQTSTVDSTEQQTTENVLRALEIAPNGNENLNEHGWEFRDGLLEGEVHNGNPESKTFDAHGSFSASSNLYSQSKKTSTVNSAQQQPTENDLSSPQIVPDVDDDFNEEGWEFRDAFSEGKVENGNPESKTSDGQRNFSAGYLANEFASPQLVLNLLHGNDDTDEDGWEFKEAFSKGKDENGNCGFDASGSHKKFSAETKLKDFIGFYSKLKDEARFFVLHHLDDLKNAMEIAALSGEESKVIALDKEIQVAYKKVMGEESVNGKVHPEEHLPINTCVQELLGAVQDPSLQMLEIEYQLSKRISLAENDLSSAVGLLEHAITVLLVLTLASEEEQSTYISSWSKMLLACEKELKHGAMIWKHLIEKNIHIQVLSEPQGLQYFLALGEIYRVAQVLRVSVSFYKPWILMKSVDSTSISQLLEDCTTSWAVSGLQESLERVADSADHESKCMVGALLESIKSIHDLEKLPLLSNFSGQDEQFCRLSLLPSSLLQDMKLVCWDGEHYFLKLANLWANRISCDPPQLPSIKVCQ